MKKYLLILLAALSCMDFHAQEIGNKVTKFDWSQFNFNYTENGVTKTANLTDEATTPDHIIGLLRAIYINPAVPGIHYAYMWRNPETGNLQLNRKLDYHYNYWPYNQEINDSTHSQRRSSGKLYGGGGKYNTWDRSLDDNMVIENPEEDGMTVLLIQLKETWNKPVGISDSGDENHLARNVIDKAYQSVQVVKAFTRVHDPYNPGYLFCIDGTATNKFFFASKGKPRGTAVSCLFRLYEQISPVKGDFGSSTYDFIAKMKSGQVHYCYHDCSDVACYGGDRVPHWFTISNEGEAYSLKNLCIYIPDRRLELQRYINEDPEHDGQYYYNDGGQNYTDYGHKNGTGNDDRRDSIIRPKVLMYTADLNATAEPSEVEDYYRVNLDWSTSFTDEKIGAHVPEHYYVYIVKDDGSWVRIDDLLNKNEPVENTLDSYLVPQTFETQTFNYVITAHPINYDMDGNMIMDGMDTLNTELGKPLVTITAVSPVRTVIIPPLDMPFFQQMLEYRSFYNVNTEENFYRNKISIKPASDKALRALKNFHGSFDVTRADTTGHKEVIAHVNFKQQAGETGYQYHVEYVESTQRDVANGLFDNGNPIVDGMITNVTDEMVIYDRFRASTVTNEQYDHYIYAFEQVEADGNGGEELRTVCSNPLNVPVLKTTNKVETEGYTRADVLDDTDHSLRPMPTNAITFTVNFDPANNLQEYDVLRVNREHHPVDEFKVGKAENFNNSGNYHVFTVGKEGYLNNMEQTVSVAMTDEPAEITVLDKHGAIDKSVSSYVPTIVSLFAGDQTKVNTYGCDILDMSYPQLNLEISAEKSNSYKQKDENGNVNTYKGYTANLHLTPILTQDIKYAYYYRIWRVTDKGEVEVLLNQLEDISGTGTNPNNGRPSTWNTTYANIQTTYPGEEPINVTDIIVKPYTSEDDDNFEATYIARLYATYIEDNGTQDWVSPDKPMKRVIEHGGKDYVIVEQRVMVNFSSVPTYIEEVAAGQVTSVTYYNLQGIPSSRPYKGLNIVVTHYARGRTTTEKVMM